MRHRGVEDPTPATVHSGPTGTPASEKYHPLILLSCAQEPLVDCLGAGSVSSYLGENIIPGTPLEILGARRDASVAREAVRMAGRPGMHINDVAVPLTCAGKMATFDPARVCDRATVFWFRRWLNSRLISTSYHGWLISTTSVASRLI